MSAESIISELNKLPLKDKLFVIERTLKSIRMTDDNRLQNAVEILYADYSSNTDLTEFTRLDNDPFYETR